MLKACDPIDPNIVKKDLQYSGWLRASTLLSYGRSVDIDLQEEKKLFSTFRNSKMNREVQQQLSCEMTSIQNLDSEGLKRSCTDDGDSRWLLMRKGYSPLGMKLLKGN